MVLLRGKETAQKNNSFYYLPTPSEVAKHLDNSVIWGGTQLIVKNVVCDPQGAILDAVHGCFVELWQ